MISMEPRGLPVITVNLIFYPHSLLKPTPAFQALLAFAWKTKPSGEVSERVESDHNTLNHVCHPTGSLWATADHAHLRKSISEKDLALRGERAQEELYLAPVTVCRQKVWMDKKTMECLERMRDSVSFPNQSDSADELCN